MGDWDLGIGMGFRSFSLGELRRSVLRPYITAVGIQVPERIGKDTS